MTWDERIGVLQRACDLLLKFEVHALVIICLGILLTFHNQKEQGTALITLGAGVFRGSRT